MPDGRIKLQAVAKAGGLHTIFYDKLEKLYEEWEDAPEEPKGTWTIDPMNENYIDDGKYTAPDELERYEELGLKFDTEEEAEKAVERLRAWKRLKDKGFRFMGWSAGCDSIYFTVDEPTGVGDLDLLFGGEE